MRRYMDTEYCMVLPYRIQNKHIYSLNTAIEQALQSTSKVANWVKETGIEDYEDMPEMKSISVNEILVDKNTETQYLRVDISDMNYGIYLGSVYLEASNNKYLIITELPLLIQMSLTLMEKIERIGI